MRPVLLKVGGSVLSDKAQKPRFKKTVCRRILSEVAKMDVPVVVLHGAGSFGHPAAKAHQIGQRTVTPDRRRGVSETLAACGILHAEVVQAAQDVGLQPISVPLHAIVESEGGELTDIPIHRIQRLLDEGYSPILSGTLVRDDELGWRVVSADEIMELLAIELHPRLAIFATDVDGVHDRDPKAAGSQRIDVLQLPDLDRIQWGDSKGADVTGAMRGKLERAFAVASECPTWIVDGTVRGRVMDVLKGKTVPGTRVQA